MKTKSAAGITATPIGGPQRTSPGSARSLLLTLLGEFVLPRRAPTWTAPLLHALAGVGVAEKAGRQAIARAATAGWIERDRNGRRTSWRIGERGQYLIAEGSKRVKSLSRIDGEVWDRTWMILHITMPNARRADRLRLYRALSWIGFGNPTPGIWISPHASRADEARRVIDEMHLAQHTLAFTAKTLNFGIPERELVPSAWDLDAVADHYGALVERFSAMRPRTADEVLFAHILLVNELQRLPSIDPGLPRALLPHSWDNRRQTARLAALREKWRELAHARWDRLSAETVE